MPVNPTYPGVYVEELPSGVHTITGVSTSVTAFVGLAKRGPINKAVHIFSFADYDQAFGGLSKDSDMSYAVSQFFLNGGNEAWIVRLALNAAFASVDLLDDAQKLSMTVTAVDEGAEANNIQVIVGASTAGSGAFDLTFVYTSQDTPASNRTETYKGLSIAPASARFVEDVINGDSLLVTVKAAQNANPPRSLNASAASLTSGAFTKGDIDSLPDATQKSFMIGFAGKADTLITLDTSNIPDPKKADTDLGVQLKDMASRIQKAVRGFKPNVLVWGNFTCTASSDNTTLILTSGVTGDKPSVTVGAASSNDISAKLHFDTATATPGTAPTLLQGGKGDPFEINNNPEVFFPNDSSGHTGVYALDKVDIFNLLCLPAVTEVVTLNNAIVYCKSRRAFLIIDAPQHPGATPPGFTPQEMVVFITGSKLVKADDGTYAALYYPWPQAPDVLNNGKLRSFAPCGMIAGLYANTDSTRGVWKAPAGTSANLVNVQGMDFLLTNDENGELNPLGVNCLRIFPIYGAVCWGARTVSGADAIASDYKYVPVRRTALFLEESLYRGLQWVVFEPNDEPLWAQIRLNVGAFMHDLFRKGAFQGQTPKDAYLVKCDSETTTQTDINHGIVNILVGFAPLKPAEFVILQIEQLAGQIQV